MYVYQLTNTTVITCLRGCPLGETTAYIIKYERIKTGIELIYEKQMFFTQRVLYSGGALIRGDGSAN